MPNGPLILLSLCYWPKPVCNPKICSCLTVRVDFKQLHSPNLFIVTTHSVYLCQGKEYTWVAIRCFYGQQPSLVQPHLEFSCHVWEPFLIKGIDQLESVQKFVIKIYTLPIIIADGF